MKLSRKLNLHDKKCKSKKAITQIYYLYKKWRNHRKMSFNMTIRPLRIDDYETVLNWSRDEEFCAANGWEMHRDAQELYQWWLNCVNHSSEDFIRKGIELDGRLIGYVDLACMKDQSAELGIAIGESSLWGKGIGYYASKRIIDYASKNFELTLFSAETHETNLRARRLLEKLGFNEISRVSSEIYMGKDTQLIQYTLYISDYISGKSG